MKHQHIDKMLFIDFMFAAKNSAITQGMKKLCYALITVINSYC